MKLTEFRVQNYRSITDSGWVKIDDIAVIVGKNESGKTSLLKALWKFKPFNAEPYSLDREWPRGKRKDRSPSFEVVTTRFDFTDAEKAQLAGIDPQCAGLLRIEIGRTYDGKFASRWEPHAIPVERNGISAKHLLHAAVSARVLGKPAEVVEAMSAVLASTAAKLDAADGSAARALIPEVKGQLVEAATLKADAALAQSVGADCDGILAKMAVSPSEEAWQLAQTWIPTFIYMDDWLAFKGTAHLDQLKQRKDSNQLRDDDRTIITILEMAGLSLDEEVAKGALPDREQRMLDMNDASQTLTNEIAARWSQKKYEVQFNVDGYHFVTFVKDESAKALVPLEERSKGFQWFFSFDMKFMYETNGDFKNAVILLDEPGLHLHAAAQRDLLARLKAYARQNQLIYTTHLPFMIDMNRLDNIWVAEERPGEGTKVHAEWATADKDARFTLQAALGLSWAQSLFIGQKNLVVEGVTDFWFLSTMSTLLKDAGEPGLSEDLVVTPAGGASKVAYLATLLSGQELRVAALLDSDEEGIKAQKQLVHNWLLSDSDVLMLGVVVGVKGTFAIEDLFDPAYYLEHTTAAYSKELRGQSLKLRENLGGSIVDRLTAQFAELGVAFNKGRVAKRIMKDLADKQIADFPVATVDGFRKAIGAVNAVAARWTAG
ncbi:AAA ATPase domain-containing protein [Paraburkholderia steynii]|uniref:AAA ATPase domain-containing protein n=1 Tax=Paraburkholderia steynii TaxID=1245441 RepID=A0A7Z7B0D2_9BURK|nr:AAA family ATPase [Paraburkholderia steynii]SDG97677.1 AAA ATPase domain-containing protein [Paraburkholderia steynii]